MGKKKIEIYIKEQGSVAGAENKENMTKILRYILTDSKWY